MINNQIHLSASKYEVFQEFFQTAYIQSVKEWSAEDGSVFYVVEISESCSFNYLFSISGLIESVWQRRQEAK